MLAAITIGRGRLMDPGVCPVLRQVEKPRATDHDLLSPQLSWDGQTSHHRDAPGNYDQGHMTRSYSDAKAARCPGAEVGIREKHGTEMQVLCSGTKRVWRLNSFQNSGVCDDLDDGFTKWLCARAHFYADRTGISWRWLSPLSHPN